MQTFRCQCGNPLFYDNTHCVACQAEVGFCPACRQVTALAPLAKGGYRCLQEGCGAALMKCHNYAVENVCNRMVLLDDEGQADTLCDCCRHNEVIPDLTIDGHRARWAALEAAKRRLFYTLDQLKLAHPAKEDGAPLPLSFSFMADALPDDGLWRSMAGQEKVYTGHAAGHITINLMEADTVERERLRVDLNESHRTLIGHFRHEIGHYYWDLLVKEQDEAACIALFGDHNAPTYAEALERYYQEGPPADWRERFISAYATMHPWEDFAETFALYLDIVSVVDTALHLGVVSGDYDGTLERLLLDFHQVGLSVNELNRDMGLLDLAPSVIAPPVHEKLAYIHELIRRAAGSEQAPAATP